MSEQHFQVLIVGGGAAGVSVANNMRRQNSKIKIGLIEPSEKHYYQPGFHHHWWRCLYHERNHPQ